MHIGLERRFGGAGPLRDRRRDDRLRRLGGLQAQVAPRFPEQDRYATTRSYRPIVEFLESARQRC
jgi:hypothetical protein